MLHFLSNASFFFLDELLSQACSSGDLKNFPDAFFRVGSG